MLFYYNRNFIEESKCMAIIDLLVQIQLLFYLVPSIPINNFIIKSSCYVIWWHPFRGTSAKFQNTLIFLCTSSEEEISANRPYYNPDTTTIKAKSGEGCPRCGGKVFAAEQQLAKGTVRITKYIPL